MHHYSEHRPTTLSPENRWFYGISEDDIIEVEIITERLMWPLAYTIITGRSRVLLPIIFLQDSDVWDPRLITNKYIQIDGYAAYNMLDKDFHVT